MRMMNGVYRCHHVEVQHRDTFLPHPVTPRTLYDLMVLVCHYLRHYLRVNVEPQKRYPTCLRHPVTAGTCSQLVFLRCDRLHADVKL